MPNGILIRNAFVLTMDSPAEIPHGAVYIQGDRIEAVGPTVDLEKRYRGEAEQVIDATDHLLIPGLIDGHTHAGADRLARAFTLEIDLPTLLVKYKWPLLCEVTPNEIQVGAELTYLEAIRNGVTTTVVNYYAGRGINQEGVPKAAKALGVRTVLARGYHDFPYKVPDKLLETPEQIYREYQRLFQAWHTAENGRIRVAIAPVNLAYAAPENLKPLVELAKHQKAGFHTHVAEVNYVADALKERTGQTYVEILDNAGALGPLTQAAHGVYLTDGDISRLAATKTSVIHNPVSNMLYASGVCPIPRLQQAGVNVALGSDSHEGIIVAMRQAAYLRKIVTLDPQAMSAREALQMATRNGAQALGMANSIGRISPGYKADLALLSTFSVDPIPWVDPYIVLIYLMHTQHVRTVIIDGNLILHEGRFVNFDERQTLLQAKEIQEVTLSRYYP